MLPVAAVVGSSRVIGWPAPSRWPTGIGLEQPAVRLPVLLEQGRVSAGPRLPGCMTSPAWAVDEPGRPPVEARPHDCAGACPTSGPRRAAQGSYDRRPAPRLTAVRLQAQSPRPVTPMFGAPSPLDRSLTKDRVTTGPSTPGRPSSTDRAARPRLADPGAAPEAACSRRTPRPRPPCRALRTVRQPHCQRRRDRRRPPHARQPRHQHGQGAVPPARSTAARTKDRVTAHPCPAPDAAPPARVGTAPGRPTAALPSRPRACAAYAAMPGRLPAPQNRPLAALVKVKGSVTAGTHPHARLPRAARTRSRSLPARSTAARTKDRLMAAPHPHPHPHQHGPEVAPRPSVHRAGFRHSSTRTRLSHRHGAGVVPSLVTCRAGAMPRDRTTGAIPDRLSQDGA